MVFANPVTHKYATWVHVILRETSFHVGLMAVCKWPIIAASVITLQNNVSVAYRAIAV